MSQEGIVVNNIRKKGRLQIKVLKFNLQLFTTIGKRVSWSNIPFNNKSKIINDTHQLFKSNNTNLSV